MLASSTIITVAGLYLGGLFLLAWFTDHRAAQGSGRFVGSSISYTLSLAVYCTSWTFFGAVGSAVRSGLEYLTIYIGPTLALMAWWYLLRKLIRISKAQHITSIADFVSARYGKSASLSALITVIAVIVVTPYIALQLKAVAAAYNAVSDHTGPGMAQIGERSLPGDTGLWVAICMGAFVILFGTRNLGADERHPGVVAAIALESMVKLFSLGAIACFALYGLNDGVADLFHHAAQAPSLQRLFMFGDGFEPRWIVTTFLSAAAMICLPRQFQVAVVENSDERHLATASWVFPLYLLLFSLFVIPIAIAGVTRLPEGMNPDLFVLTLPQAFGRDSLVLLAFVGGLSAGTSMVIMASIALSIMISNHLVTPLLLRLPYFTPPGSGDFSRTLLLVRRFSIVTILTLGYVYYRTITSADPLASIGLVSFAGVAQFLPALLGGIFWRGATKSGATTGLLVGFAVWIYTLLLPNFAYAGSPLFDMLQYGPWGIDFLQPDALFGLNGWDGLVHGLFWSLSLNIAAYVGVSLLTNQSPIEQLQSAIFVDAFERGTENVDSALQRSAHTDDLLRLTQSILGHERAYRLFRDYARSQGRKDDLPVPDPALIAYVERQLASSVGAASARTLVSRIVMGETITVEAVISILDETQQAIRYSRELERKSHELEETAEKLRRANEQLRRLDMMKDDFLSQVSHELRTPMTSIRSFAEILVNAQDVEAPQTRRFLGIIQQESERLTRLLDEILDLNRVEADQVDWQLRDADAAQIAHQAMAAMAGLAKSHGAQLVDALGDRPLPVRVEPDRLQQVFINLISNAIRHNDSTTPVVRIEGGFGADGSSLEIRVRDNGPGIPPEDRDLLFGKFSRGWANRRRRRGGSGLGLAISHSIIQRLGGALHLEDQPGPGASFLVRLPLKRQAVAQATTAQAGGA
jgi:Na+/proline symporter/nitrogen-specific signal transduction histidine kinase